MKTAKVAKSARPLLLSIGQDGDRHYGSASLAVRMSGVCPVFSGVLGDLGGSSFQFVQSPLIDTNQISEDERRLLFRCKLETTDMRHFFVLLRLRQAKLERGAMSEFASGQPKGSRGTKARKKWRERLRGGC